MRLWRLSYARLAMCLAQHWISFFAPHVSWLLCAAPLNQPEPQKQT
jgi:hypothetical protein